MEIWAKIKMLEGETVKTLERSKPFLIVSVQEDHLTISPQETKKPRDISRKAIEDSYQNLLANGFLDRTTIRDKFSEANPAYVAAILSKLEGVSFRTSPITLRIKKTG